MYYTPFESHLPYGITVWGGITNTRLEPLFKCMRILFGDTNAYLDKSRTCARVREFGKQKLGLEFYKREHNKPPFNERSIMNVRILYGYHCSNELFKLNSGCPRALSMLKLINPSENFRRY